MFSKAKTFNQYALNFLLPPQCLSCREIIENNNNLCNKCWGELKFITSPKCKKCSIPFFDTSKDGICFDCVKNPPFYDKTHVAVIYNDLVKKLISRFKNYDCIHYADFFAKFLINMVPKRSEIIIPVPLHFLKLIFRQYNQSAQLINSIAKHRPALKKNFSILLKNKNINLKTIQTKNERYKALLNVFEVKNKELIKNKNILLVDDIVTSGATINACAKILKENGAKKVDILAIARTLKN